MPSTTKAALVTAIEKLKACRLTDAGGAPQGVHLTPLECEAILRQLPYALVSAAIRPQGDTTARELPVLPLKREEHIRCLCVGVPGSRIMRVNPKCPDHGDQS